MIKNEEKITKEFCQGKRLVFFPKTEEDAALIQRRIFEMGYEWAEDEAPCEAPRKIRRTAIGNLSKGVSTGMMLWNGYFYLSPNDSLPKAFLCTSDQFSENYKSDHQIVLEIFNKLSTKMDAIAATTENLSVRMAAIEEYLRPQVIPKPFLTKPQRPGA